MSIWVLEYQQTDDRGQMLRRWGWDGHAATLYNTKAKAMSHLSKIDRQWRKRFRVREYRRVKP